MKTTKSSIFIFPMLDIPIEKFPGFVNCYIDKREYAPSSIQVLCNMKLIGNNFTYFCKNKHDKRKLLCSIIELQNGFTLLSFRTPDKYKIDFYKFLQGKYSEFSEGYKQQLLKYFPKYITEDGKTRLHNNYAIIYPDKKYRKLLEARLNVSLDENSEIYSRPNMKEETLNIEDIENKTITCNK